MSRSRVLALGCVVLLSVACSKKDGGTSLTDGLLPKKEITLDPKLVELVKLHAASCTVSLDGGSAYSCKGDTSDQTRKYVQDTKPAGFIGTLATMAQGKEDPKIAACAVAVLADHFDNLGEDGKRRAATPEALTALLAALQAAEGGRAQRMAKPAAQTATILKALPKLEAVVDTHSVKWVRDEAYRHLLTFGRLEAFPKIKAVAADKPEHREAALDALRYMYKATEAEKNVVCPWAQGYLSDVDGNAASSAGRDMVMCRGMYIDALMGEADKRVKAKQYKNPFAMVMREPCFEMIGVGGRSAAEEAQCERVYAFLEKAANDPTIDNETRGLALWNIYYQRRDEKTLKLMRKYENNANPEVSKRAKEAIKSLTESYKLKG